MVLLRTSMLVTLATSVVCLTASGQATPTATASTPYSQFTLPDVGGELRYALTASESLITGYNGTAGGGVSSYTNLGGDLAYLSRNPLHQFSAVYAGGYLIGGGSFPSYFYQTLTLSQGYRTKHWNFLVGDAVSYLPQTPIGSLSGVPGTGDAGLPTVPINSLPTLGILTTYTTRVDNVVSGSATRDLTAATSLSFSGADQLERYVGSKTAFQGINNDQQSASASLQHRISERTTVGGQYAFTNSSFHASSAVTPGNYGYQTHSGLLTVTKQFNPDLTLSASVGPQWSVSAGDGGLTQGNAVNVAANASLAYQARLYSAAVNYSRGINNGNGVVLGSRMDSVIGNISRPFARIYNVGALVGWNHSEQLPNSLLPTFSNQAVVAGGQLSVQIRPSLSAFASYTVQRQEYSGFQAAGIAFNGLTQYGSFGVTYSPRPIFSRK